MYLHWSSMSVDYKLCCFSFSSRFPLVHKRTNSSMNTKYVQVNKQDTSISFSVYVLWLQMISCVFLQFIHHCTPASPAVFQLSSVWHFFGLDHPWLTPTTYEISLLWTRYAYQCQTIRSWYYRWRMRSDALVLWPSMRSHCGGLVGIILPFIYINDVKFLQLLNRASWIFWAGHYCCQWPREASRHDYLRRRRYDGVW